MLSLRNNTGKLNFAAVEFVVRFVVPLNKTVQLHKMINDDVFTAEFLGMWNAS